MPRFHATLSSSFGTSSPIMSRPLSVNHSSRVFGCHAKPTVLRTPSANTSRFDPSGFIRPMVAVFGAGRQVTATKVRMKADGPNLEVFAEGVRNTVGFARSVEHT